MKKLLTLTPRSIIMFWHTFIWAFLGLAAAVINPTGRLFTWVAGRFWARQLVWLSGMKVTVKGVENVERGGIYVVCANHQSLMDIPLLFASLPFLLRFVAKRSLFYIPVFGWSLFLAGFIPVDRGVRAGAKRSLERGARRIKRGPSLVVFPEGTRTEDGLMHDFKTGAFTMAIRSNVPVLPVAIRGSFNVVPKTRLAVQPLPVEVIIGQPIPTAELRMKDKAHLRRRVQETVEAMVESGEPTETVTEEDLVPPSSPKPPLKIINTMPQAAHLSE